jgi:pimeloyl-ACP methyl ester carboxylesterase
MNKVFSRDGTPIAFDRSGQGPAVILVDGALCHRKFGPSADLAALLAPKFTVYTYDRRGRGESGNTAPYATEREVEDIAALVQEAGGAAFACGISSGGALVLEAARRGVPIEKMAIYEAPFVVDDTYPPLADGYLAQLKQLIVEDRRGDAVRMFMQRVGVPAIMIALMRIIPVWSKLKAVAHTLPYDIAIVEDYQKGKPLPAGRWDSVKAPAMVFAGGKSPAWMRNGMKALAGALPNGKLRTLEGQTHMVKAKVVVPVLSEFFSR